MTDGKIDWHRHVEARARLTAVTVVFQPLGMNNVSPIIMLVWLVMLYTNDRQYLVATLD